MTLKLFVDIASQPSRAVLLFCKRCSIPVEVKTIAIRKKEHLSEEYSKINPFNRVPAISDDGMNLTESVAILEYLATKHKVADHWFPADVIQRARVHEFLSWQHGGLRFPVASAFLKALVIPMQTGKKLDDNKAKKAWDAARQSFRDIESVFLKEQPYVAGNQISVADLLGVCEAMQAANLDIDYAKEFPVLTQWIKRVREDTNPDFDEVHSVIYNLLKMKKFNL